MPVAYLRASVKAQVEKGLDAAAAEYLREPYLAAIDFSSPAGEPAFNSPQSVSWRIFKNPISLFIGGVTAVILEFAEPRVRSGVWEHSTFRHDPVARLKRTGLAAMATVYAARSVSEAMIERVNRLHGNITGVTPQGVQYRADDPALLNWVHATAAFGFIEAYSAYVRPLTDEQRNQFYQEGVASAIAYGAHGAPTSLSEQRTLFSDMTSRLEASDIIFEFREIMRNANAFPGPARYVQRPLIRAAIELVPEEIREILGLDRRYGLRPFERSIVKRMGARSDRLALVSSPPAQACVRMGLPPDYLYR